MQCVHLFDEKMARLCCNLDYGYLFQTGRAQKERQTRKNGLLSQEAHPFVPIFPWITIEFLR